MNTDNSLITNIFFTGIAIVLFIKNFKLIKVNLNRVAEYTGYFTILILVNILFTFVLVGIILEITDLLKLLGIVKIFLMVNVSLIYINKMNLVGSTLIFPNNVSQKEILNIRFYFKSVIPSAIMLILLKIIFFLIQDDWSEGLENFTPHVVLYLLINALITATFVEIVYRLFLQSLLVYIFRAFKNGYFLAIFLTAIIWTFSDLNFEFYIIDIIHVFLIGLILGFQMKKFGWESCVISLTIYLFIKYLFWGV